MKRLAIVALLALVALGAAACPINHWTARQELAEQGYTEIYFGEVPGEPAKTTFFARRAEDVCSGVVDLSSAVADVRSRCRAPGATAGH
jgi:hypothetical protein